MMRIASKCVAGWMAVAALVCAPVIFGQEVGAPATPPKPKTVEVTPTNIQAHVGDKVKFTAVAKDASGKVTNWRVESAAPNGLLREGWVKNSLKAGDAVTIEAYQAKDEKNFAKTTSVTLPGGRRVFTGYADERGDRDKRSSPK